MRVLFCGSRDHDNWDIIREVIKNLPSDTIIIHGAARGADSLAGYIAKQLGYKVEAYPADWEQFGKRAGYLRNIEMLNTGLDHVHAFWDGVSKGTASMIRIAKEAGVPVTIHES